MSDKSTPQQIASETYRKVKEVEYRREAIYDKNGVILNYDHNPDEYKKARKRIQNRESAIRARHKKKRYFTEIEVKMDELENDNKRLSTENAALVAEKKILLDQLEYFKSLVGSMNFSSKNTTITHSRGNSSQAESLDEEKDGIILSPYAPQEGELPHLGNYKRPIGARRPASLAESERLVLNRKNEKTVASTAGLFFMAIVMCVLCFTSLTMTGSNKSGQGKKDFSLENPNRQLMALQKSEEHSSSFLIWLTFLIGMIMAYCTRITIAEGRHMINKGLIKCYIIKDPAKKTKSS